MSKDKTWQLASRVFITGQIMLVSDLHIGADDLSVSGEYYFASPNNPIIRDYKNDPMIPASSLKGCMRSEMDLQYHKFMIADEDSREGEVVKLLRKGKKSIGAVLCNNPNCWVEKVFGRPSNDPLREPTRLQVCDSLIEEKTESIVRTENAIHRLLSSANPRKSEYVPAGTKFNVQLVYTIFDYDDYEKGIPLVLQALNAIQDSGIGGGRSRGGGRIKLINLKMAEKTFNHYKEGSDPDVIVSEQATIEDMQKEYKAWLNGKEVDDKGNA
jgi:CRISPR-associated protein Csm3